MTETAAEKMGNWSTPQTKNIKINAPTKPTIELYLRKG